MSFIYIASLVIIIAIIASIHQRLILKRANKTKSMYRLHWGAVIAASYLIIQIYNPVVFLTAAAGILTLARGYDYLREKYSPRQHDIALITELSRDMWLFVLIVWAFRTLVYDYSPVPSGSMEPTLLAGDLVAVNKLAYQVKIPPLKKPLYVFSTPQRGDVVVINSPLDPEQFYIKRIIAVGGDTVTYRDKMYYVNDKVYPQNDKKLYYTESSNGSGWYAQADEVINDKVHKIQLDDSQFNKEVSFQVPEGKYFISGDNRDFSLDSRMFGPIDGDSIVGKATHILVHFQLPQLISLSRTGEIR